MADRLRTYLDRDTRKQKLLDLGMQLFANRSYEDVSIDDVAREANISKGLLYHYFGSKRVFYTEVVRFATAHLLELIHFDPSVSGPENVRRGLLTWFEFAAARGEAVLSIMHGGGTSDEVGQILEEARHAFVMRIFEGLELNDPHPIFRAVSRNWIGSVEAAARDWLEHRDVAPSTLVDLLLANLFSQLLIATQLAPEVKVKLEIGAGLRLLGPLLARVMSTPPASR